MAMMQQYYEELLHLVKEMALLSKEKYSESLWAALKEKAQKQGGEEISSYIESIEVTKQKELYLFFTVKIFELIQEVNTAVFAQMPVSDILSLCTARLRQISRVSIVMTYMQQPEAAFSYTRQAMNGSKVFEQYDISIDATTGLFHEIVTQQTPYLIEDLAQHLPIHPLFEQLYTNAQMRPIMIAPIVHNEVCIGFFILAGRNIHTPPSLYVKMFQHFCSQFSIALHHADMYAKELQLLALHEQVVASALDEDYRTPVDRLARLTNIPIRLLDTTGQLLHVTDVQVPAFQQIEQLDEQLIQKSFLLQSQVEIYIQPYVYTVFPIHLNDKIIAYMVMPTVFDTHALQRLMVEQFRNVLALKLHQERASIEIEFRLRQDYLYDLIIGNATEQDLRRRGRYLQMDFQLPHHVIVLTMRQREHLKYKRIHQVLEQIRNMLARDILPFSFVHEEQLVIITPLRQTEATIRELLSGAKHIQMGTDVLIGVSHAVKAPPTYKNGYTEATKAAEFATLFGMKKQVIHYKDLGIVGMLFQASNVDMIHQYEQTYLSALIAYDKKHQTELLKTLRVYLHHESVIQAAATELYVHYNTLRNRIKRIEEVTKLSLDDPQHKLNLRIALVIHQLVEHTSSV